MLALQQGHTLQRGPTRPFPAGPSPKRGASPASKAAPLHESNPSRGRGLHHIVSYPSAASRPAPALRPGTNAARRRRSTSSHQSFPSPLYRHRRPRCLAGSSRSCPKRTSRPPRSAAPPRLLLRGALERVALGTGRLLRGTALGTGLHLLGVTPEERKVDVTRRVLL